MRSDPGHDLARTLAAVLGAGPTALAVGVATVHALPTSFAWRFALGAHVVVPAWVALIWAAFVAKNGARAWLRLGVLAVLSALVVALRRGTT